VRLKNASGLCRGDVQPLTEGADRSKPFMICILPYSPRMSTGRSPMVGSFSESTVVGIPVIGSEGP
jgi:hypothetical protein